MLWTLVHSLLAGLIATDVEILLITRKLRQSVELPRRSLLLTIFLLLAIAAVATRTYLLWHEGLGDLPTVVRRDPPASVTKTKLPIAPQPLATTEVIIGKNLFDPERGATKTKEAEADTRAVQRVRSLVLLGTAILGANQYAILQESSTSGAPTPPGRSAGPLRYKLGDVFEGFNLSEIRDKNVVFSKGASRVELALDYFRKIEAPASARVPAVQRSVAGAVPVPGQVAPVSPLVPRVLPQLPRRERLPAPPNP
jgi:hypothetical protein